MLHFTKFQTCLPQKPLLTLAPPVLVQGSSVLLLFLYLGFPVSQTHSFPPSSPPCPESPLQPDRTLSCKLCRGSLEPKLRRRASGTWIPMGRGLSLRPAHLTQSSPVSGENLMGPRHGSPSYSQFSPQPKICVSANRPARANQEQTLHTFSGKTEFFHSSPNPNIPQRNLTLLGSEKDIGSP